MAKKKPEITQKTWQQAYQQYEYERQNNLYNTLVTAKGQDEYKKKRREEYYASMESPLFDIGTVAGNILGGNNATGITGGHAGALLGKAIGKGGAEALKTQKENWIGNALKNAGNAVLEQVGKTEGGKMANAVLGGFNLYLYKKEQEMLGYDLEAGKKELDELHEQLWLLDQEHTKKTQADYKAGNARVDEQYQAERAILEGKIEEKERYINKAALLQEQDEWLAYMDDPEFEKYAAEGELMDGFDVKTMSGNLLLTDRANGGYAAAQMTGDERKLYYYLLAKHGNELAIDYLKYMNPIVNQREGQKQGQAFTDFLNTDITGSPIFDAPIKSIAFLGHGLHSGLDQWYSGVQQIFKDEAMAPSVQQFAAQTVKENVGTVGGWIYDAAQTTGNMVPSILTSKLLGPAGFYTTFGASAYGNAYGEALKMGYDKGQAMAYGALVSASEVTLQKILGGIPGMTGSKAKSLVEKLGAIENKLLRVTAQSGALALSEIAEEEMQLFLEPAFRTIINGEDYDAPEIDEIIDTAIVTMLSTGAMNAPSSINSYQTGRDMATGYTQDEQKVIDYLVDKEMGNKELSNKEIKEIEERVKKQISRGEVSLDTIEEVLGGETYQEYQKAAEKEDAAWNEISQLYEGDELVEQRRKFFESSKLLEMKQKLGQEVAQKVGNGFLAESYNQVAQRGNRFTADTSGYSEAERDIIKRAIDSGVLNNTRKTHDFVDLVAKLSAQKGIKFDFTNNKKLADTGFALEGKTVNGFVEGNTVTLNMNSAKYLNTVVGHEITHVLEGTELYDDFQKLMFDYAKSKKSTDGKFDNEYLERLYNTRKIYENLEEYQGADGHEKIEKEVLSDLVGDYLFTDSDFINHLSSNKGLVRKIYDEIRYMVKLAKADTAEAKELVKLEKAFQDMYKQDSVVVDGKKLSMTDSKGKELSKGQQEFFVDSKARNNNGQLVSLYHGTENGGFTIFDPSFSDDGISIFLTDNPYLAATYSGSVDPVRLSKGLPKFLRWMEGDATKGKGQVGLYNVYANMKNPLVVDAHGDNWNNLSSKNLDSVRFDVVVDQESDIDWDNVKIRLITTVNGKSNTETFWSVDSLREAVASQYNNSVATNVALSAMNSNSSSVKSNVIKWNAETREEGWAETTREIARKAKEQGYDGVIIRNVFDSGKYGTHSSEEKGNVYIVFDSNQIKDVNNKKPTADRDMRYSLSSIANSFFGNGNENMTVDEFTSQDYHETEGYKSYVQRCLDNMRQSRGEAFDEKQAMASIEKQIDGIVGVAVAAKRAGYDIIDSTSKRDVRDSKNRLLFSSLEPNSEYFTSNDISTICDKRKNFADIYDEIVRQEEEKGVPAGKRFFDNVNNYFAIHKIMADQGLTTPCRQCYVESMRKNLAPMATAFLDMVQETDEFNIFNKQLWQKAKNSDTVYVVGADGKKYTKKVSNTEIRNNVLKTLEEHPEYNLTVEDLTVEMLSTEDGLAQLRMQAPLIYEYFNSFYGQAKPKMPKSATPFRFGELTALLTDNKGNIKKSLVDKINSTGGFRLQSYSDFQIQNFTDVLQVLFEAGTLGLKGHAYTKVPAFLDATEGTNLKRNISIFMYKDGNEWKIDRNDSFPDTLEQIYERVRNDETGNTGIIAVSQNADMSAWIMANDNVGYGIPFHKSGMKMDTVRNTEVTTEDGRKVMGYSGIKDHTKQQTEVWATTTSEHKANTKVKHGINVYSFWDFANTEGLSKNKLIEKNVKRYIDECEKAGYLPKFREYVMNNGKVLQDVLKYSKELGFMPENATIDDISFRHKGYTIPYGYYKFLGDFGMFKPNGEASDQEVLSLENYGFAKAERFFSNAEKLHRNEILQQFSNGKVRDALRESNLTTEQLEELVRERRGKVAEKALGTMSLSSENEVQKDYGDYRVKGEELSYNGISPWLQNWIDEANGVAEDAAVDVAPTSAEDFAEEDLAPVREDVTEEADIRSELEGLKRGKRHTAGDYTVFAYNAYNSNDAKVTLHNNITGETTSETIEDGRSMTNDQLKDRIAGMIAADGQVAVGAAESGFDPISHLQYEYGTLPMGEHPVREDSMPISTDGNNRVSLTPRTVKGAESTPDEFVDLLDQEVVGGALSYIPISNNATTQDAIESIRSVGWAEALANWQAAVRNGQVSAKLSATGALLLNNAAKAGDRKAWLDILYDYQTMGTNAGQAVQALRILKTLNPDDSLYMIEKSINRMIAELGLKGLEVDQELLDAYKNAQSGEEKNAAIDAISQQIAKQIPKTLREGITAIRYLNMLGNFRTQIRNVGGNAAMGVTTYIKNKISAALQAIAHAVSGKFERTNTLFVSPAQYKAAFADYKNVEQLALGDKFNDNGAQTALKAAIEKHRKILPVGLEQYRRATNWAMDIGDKLFSRPAYARALAGYLKAHGVTETDYGKVDPTLLDQARAHAIKMAQEQTFRSNGQFASWLARLGRNKNSPGWAKTLGEAIVPFRKTPANILIAAEQYSPLGLINTVVNAVRAANPKTDVKGADVIESLSKTITGSGLFVLGMWMFSSGLVTVPSGDDEKDRYNQMMGQQTYAIQLPGGFNFTIDWLSPSAVPFLMGAEMMNSVEENGLSLHGILDSLGSLSNPLMEMSMLQGLNDTLENVKYSDDSLVQLLVNASLGYLTQGLSNPLLGQLERSLEANRQQTFVDKDSQLAPWLQRWLGGLSAKTPFLDYNQIPYINAWGEEEEPGSFVENLFSPSYFDNAEDDFVSEELNRLNDVQDKYNVYPSTPSKTVTFVRDGEAIKDYNLSADEYVALAKNQGQTQRRLIEDLISNPEYEKLTDAEKAKAVKLVYEYSRDSARIDVLGADGFDAKWMGEISGDTVEAIIAHSSDERRYAYDNPEKYGAVALIGYDNYKTYNAALNNIKAGDNTKAKKKEYIWSLDIPEGQKCLLFKLEYPADKTYDNTVFVYVNSQKGITAAEKKAILKNLGLS